MQLKAVILAGLIILFSVLLPQKHFPEALAIESERLSVVYCKDCTPFEFTDDDGQPAGMIIDHWRLWEEKTGIGVDYVPAPWEQTLELTRKGEVDAHAGLFYSKDRDEYLLYGPTLSKTDTHVFYHHSLPFGQNEDLTAYRVGVIAGDFLDSYLRRTYPDAAVTAYPTYDALMDDLAAGKLRLFAADTLTGLYHLRASGLGVEYLYKSNQPLYRSDWFVAVPEGRQDTLDIIDKGMALVTKEESKLISRRWTAATKGGETDALVIAIDRNYPPFTLVGPDGRPTGMLVDIWNKWSEITGTSITFLPLSWAETIEALESGQADIHFGLFANPEREAWIAFSQPLTLIETSVYYRTGVTPPASLEGLAYTRVAAMKGSHQESWLKEHYPDIMVVSLPDNEAMILALLKGDVDALVNEVPLVEADLDRMNLSGALVRGVKGIMTNTLHAGVLKERTELARLIDEGLAAIPVQHFVEIEKRWITNPNDRFYTEVDESLGLSAEEMAWVREHSVIRVAAIQDWPPFEYVNPEGDYTGISVNVLSLAARRAGLKIEPVFNTWGAQVQALKDKTLDLTPSVAHTPEREAFLLFTEPYLVSNDAVFVVDTRTDIKAMKDLEGKTVAIEEGYAGIDVLRTNYPGVRLELVTNTLQALKAVSTGDADAYYGAQPVATYLIQKHMISNLKPMAYNKDRPMELRFGVRKDWPTLQAVMQKALNSISPREHHDIVNAYIAIDAIRQSKAALTPEEKNWINGLDGPVIVGAEMDWPPFDYVEDGQATGFSNELVRLAAEKVGLPLEFVFNLTWAQLVEQFKAGKIDVLPGVYKTPAREKEMAFTKYYAANPSVLVGRMDTSDTRTLDDLAGKRLAVVDGFSINTLIEEKHPEIELVVTQNVLNALKAVSLGKADAFVGSLGTISHLLKENMIPDIQIVDEVSLDAPEATYMHMAVLKDRAILRNILQKGLEAITSKELNELRNRFLSPQAQRQLTLSNEEETWLEGHKEIRLGVDPSWLPFEGFQDNGQYAGIVSEYMKWLNEKLDVSMTPQRGMSWQEVIGAVKSGDVDVLPCVTITPSRKDFLYFTKPYLQVSIVAVTRGENAPFVAGMEDLAGMIVATVEDSPAEEWLMHDHPEIRLLRMKTLGDCLQAVSEGEADATLGNRASVTYAIRLHALDNLKIAANLPKTLDLAMGIRKDWPEMVPILDKALAAIPEADRRSFKDRWVNIQVAERLDWGLIWRWGLAVGIIGVVILGSFIYWNRKLSLEVADRKTAEAKVRAMSEASLDAVIMIDGKGMVLFWNAAAERMFGYSAEEALGKEMHLLFVPEEYRPQAFAGLEQFARTGTGEALGKVLELYAMGAQGQRFPVEVAVSPFKLEDGWYAVGSVRDITQRKMVEEQVRAARKELQLIFDSSQVGIMFMHGECELARVNNSMAEMLGYESPKAMVSSNMRDLHLSEETFEAFKLANHPVLQRGEKSRVECQLKKTDGSPVWCSLSGKAIDTAVPPDLAQGVIWVVEDITERKQMEEMLRKSERHFRMILATASEGFWHVDNDTVTKDVNDAMCQIMGRPRNEVLGKPMAEFLDEANRAIVQEQIERRIKGETGSYELAIARPDGSQVPTILHAAPIYDDQGVKIGSFAMVTDIAERKAAEEELRIKEKRLRSYFSNSLVGVTITSPDTGWIEVNGRFQEMLGYSLDELLPLSWVDLSHPEDLDADLAQYDRMLAGEFDSYTMDKRFLRKDGSVIHTNIAITCVRNDSGDVKMVMGSYIDISERVEAQRERDDAFEVITGSINYATNIQGAILPSSEDMQKALVEHFVLWEPRDKVGGDIYFMKPWGLGKLIALGDCTGHGVPGAFMTLIANGALEMAVLEVPPGEVGTLLQRTHQLLQKSLDQDQKGGASDDGIEMGVCYLAPRNKKMIFGGARFSLFCVQGGAVKETKGDKKGLGYRGIPSNVTFCKQEVPLDGGGTYYMTTDGFIDQIGGVKRRGFGKKRFKELLLEVEDMPMHERGARLLAALEEYQGNERRRDDVAVIGFRLA